MDLNIDLKNLKIEDIKAQILKFSDKKTIVGIKGSGGLSQKSEDPIIRRQEAVYAQGWYDAIVQDMFA